MPNKNLTQPQISIDQSFFDAINVPEDFVISDDITVSARRLTMRDLSELRKKFPSWRTMDTNDLMTLEDVDIFEVIIEIVWIGIRRDTDDFSKQDELFDVIHTGNMDKWQPVISFLLGNEVAETDDVDLPPEKADSVSEARQGNG